MEDKAPLENQTPTLDKDAEIKALREELAAFKREQKEKEINNSLEKKLEELVTKRFEEREISERQKIEEARKMIEEADRNAELEQELQRNEKYNQLTGYREQKLEEFKRELALLAKLGRESEHKMSLYQNYDNYLLGAQKNDERAKAMLGRINLTFAAMNMDPEKIVKIFKRNIGVEE